MQSIDIFKLDSVCRENEEGVSIIIGDVRRNAVKREFTSMPGCDLLSDREKKVCGYKILTKVDIHLSHS